MHPDQRRIVLTALACGFLALVGECFVKIIRRLHMSDELALAALCLGSASLLIIALIFVYARHDPKPPAPVRIEDRKSWRLAPRALDGAWVHLLGATVLAVELYWLWPAP